MLIAPPGSLKSSFLEMPIREYPNAITFSNINQQSLKQLRDDLLSKRYSTFVFPAFEALYQRHSATASGVEASISALVEEGLSHFSWEDQRTPMQKSRVLVCGGMPPSFFQSKSAMWRDSGFSRRFLWVTYSLKNADAIRDAIHKWELLDFGENEMKVPRSKAIPYNITELESSYLSRFVQDQAGDATPYVLLKKILAVLKWKHRKDELRPMAIMKDFRQSLMKGGAELELPQAVEDQLRAKAGKK